MPTTSARRRRPVRTPSSPARPSTDRRTTPPPSAACAPASRRPWRSRQPPRSTRCIRKPSRRCERVLALASVVAAPAAPDAGRPGCDPRAVARAGGARPPGSRADRPAAGENADARDRRAAGGRARAQPARAVHRRTVAAHVLHRQSGHRQDDRGDAHGGDPAPPGLRPQRSSGRGHARRSGRAVHRPHRAEDQGGAQAGDGRGAVHRRGLLPVPAGERARLRPGGDRDPAAGDGEPARRPGGHPGRLQGAHGHFLPQQPGDVLAHRAPHRLPGLHAGRAARDRRPDARRAAVPPEPRRRVRRSPSTSRCAASSRTSPMRARSATHWTARACGRPIACSVRPARWIATSS